MNTRNIDENVNIGGNTTVSGDVTIGHSLKVKGWLYAQNIQGANKGAFLTESALKSEYPNPLNGWCASVGANATLYIASNGQWTQTDATMPFEKGDKGDKGDAFKFSDFTPQQIASLKVKGDTGMSAYELAKELDPSVGSEEEWIASLKGNDGADGADGKDGKDGRDGAKGDPGVQGAKGDAFKYSDFTPQQLASLKVKGDKGMSAFEIAKESDPSVGSIEEWLESLKGKNGKDGKDGAKGDKGDKGDPGGFLIPSIRMDYRRAKLIINGNGNEVSRFRYDARQGKLMVEV